MLKFVYGTFPCLAVEAEGCRAWRELDGADAIKDFASIEHLVALAWAVGYRLDTDVLARLIGPDVETVVAE